MIISQLSKEEKVIFFTSPFIDEEVLEAISQIEHNKVPTIYEFPAKFYHKF
jgi:hypothetical protein